MFKLKILLCENQRKLSACIWMLEVELGGRTNGFGECARWSGGGARWVDSIGKRKNEPKNMTTKLSQSLDKLQ